MRLITLIFFIFIFYASNSFSTNIRVVDLQIIINNNKDLINLISNIEEDQIIYREEFNEIELKLQSEAIRIEELNLILDKDEIDNEINKYNKKLKEFNSTVKQFNLHYENQINKLKSNILDSILSILKNYSINNGIDLIMDSNNYILSSNSINITDIILEDLNKNNLEISFEKYK